MSEFENTEGIRQGYIAGVAEHEGVDYLCSSVTFDRWLTERDADVAEAERERIIRSLRDFKTKFGTGVGMVYSEGFAGGIAASIDLIEGEK